jgi:hypothetical protein
MVISKLNWPHLQPVSFTQKSFSQTLINIFKAIVPNLYYFVCNPVYDMKIFHPNKSSIRIAATGIAILRMVFMIYNFCLELSIMS